MIDVSGNIAATVVVEVCPMLTDTALCAQVELSWIKGEVAPIEADGRKALVVGSREDGPVAGSCPMDAVVQTPVQTIRQGLHVETRATLAETSEDHPALNGHAIDVSVAEVTNDPLTRKLRKQYEQERQSLQKFYY